jgi:hypothetical protein
VLLVYWVNVINKNSKIQIPNSKKKLTLLGFGILNIGI